MPEPRLLSSPPYTTALGQFYSLQLFYDRWVHLEEEKRIIQPVFTLYDDRPGLINARKTFLELRDPTGYRWAQRYLGSYLHFEFLLRSTWFQEAYDFWLRELKMIIQCEAVEKIRKIAQEDSQQALTAAKYLATAEWEKPVYGRGKPSKAEMKGELKKAVQALTVQEEDAKRMGLSVIQGGKQ